MYNLRALSRASCFQAPKTFPAWPRQKIQEKGGLTAIADEALAPLEHGLLPLPQHREERVEVLRRPRVLPLETVDAVHGGLLRLLLQEVLARAAPALRRTTFFFATLRMTTCALLRRAPSLAWSVLAPATELAVLRSSGRAGGGTAAYLQWRQAQCTQAKGSNPGRSSHRF